MRYLLDRACAVARRHSDIDYAGFVSVLEPLYTTIVSDRRLRSMIERIKADKGP